MAGEPGADALTWLEPDQVGALVAGWRTQHPDGMVVELRGGRATDRAALFDEAAAALALPSWFGRNWDALYDALTDLSWLGRPAYLLVVTGADQLLTEAPGEQETLLQVLAEAAASWDRSPDPTTLTTVLVAAGPRT